MSKLKIILRHFPISMAKVPLMLAFLLVHILSSPFRLIEHLVFSARIKKQEINPSPVFIIGHWRSGTTFLHQLLSSDKQFGYINFYSAMFPNSFLWTEKHIKPHLNKLCGLFKWKIPFFNNIKYDFDFPCEEDTALLNMGCRTSAYWSYALPQSAIAIFSNTMYFTATNSGLEKEFTHDHLYLLKKISLKFQNKRLLLKSPPNTARIRLLLKTFPGAKFIYINRHPVHLFYSHRKLWNHCLNRYALQEINQQELDTIIIQTMKNMFLQYKKDKTLLNEGNLYEVNYEELQKDPLAAVKEIYDYLQLPNFIDAERNIRSQIEKTSKYMPFTYQYDEEKIKWIEKNLAG